MDKQVTYCLSELDNYDGLGLNLYWTPGAASPYWASHPNFMYDRCVATPYDFLQAAGYDCFNDDHDYSGNDEAITITVTRP